MTEKSEDLNQQEIQKRRLEDLSPIVQEVLSAINNNEELDKYKIVDIIEGLSLASGVLVITSLEEDASLRAEHEGEQLFTYLMKGLRTYLEKNHILHGSVLVGLIKTLGFVSNYLASEEEEKGDSEK